VISAQKLILKMPYLVLSPTACDPPHLRANVVDRVLNASKVGDAHGFKEGDHQIIPADQMDVVGPVWGGGVGWGGGQWKWQVNVSN
jgi:hypothetical protein